MMDTRVFACFAASVIDVNIGSLGHASCWGSLDKNKSVIIFLIIIHYLRTSVMKNNCRL